MLKFRETLRQFGHLLKMKFTCVMFIVCLLQEDSPEVDLVVAVDPEAMTMMVVVKTLEAQEVMIVEEMMTERNSIAEGQSGIVHPDVNNIRTRFEV
jgi:hypothetical protein